MREFVGWLGEKAAWAEYAESRGLCLPHLLRCGAVVEDGALRQRLAEAQAAQVERLRDEMRELVRKLEGGRRWEATRHEWAAYERATEKFVGRSGLSPLSAFANGRGKQKRSA